MIWFANSNIIYLVADGERGHAWWKSKHLRLESNKNHRGCCCRECLHSETRIPNTHLQPTTANELSSWCTCKKKFPVIGPQILELWLPSLSLRACFCQTWKIFHQGLPELSYSKERDRCQPESTILLVMLQVPRQKAPATIQCFHSCIVRLFFSNNKIRI